MTKGRPGERRGCSLQRQLMSCVLGVEAPGGRKSVYAPHVFNSWLYARDSLSLILEGPLTELCGRAPGRLVWGAGACPHGLWLWGALAMSAGLPACHNTGGGGCQTSRSSRNSPAPAPTKASPDPDVTSAHVEKPWSAGCVAGRAVRGRPSGPPLSVRKPRGSKSRTILPRS